MTEKEAIEKIEYASAFNSDNSPLTEALNLAIEALEKQISKKPIHNQDVFNCPKCSYQIVFDSHKGLYCDICGQKIDWGDDDD